MGFFSVLQKSEDKQDKQKKQKLVERLEERSSELKKKVEGLQGRNSQLKKKIEELQGRNSELIKKVEDLEERNSHLRQRVKELDSGTEPETETREEVEADNAHQQYEDEEIRLQQIMVEEPEDPNEQTAGEESAEEKSSEEVERPIKESSVSDCEDKVRSYLDSNEPFTVYQAAEDLYDLTSDHPEYDSAIKVLYRRLEDMELLDSSKKGQVKVYYRQHATGESELREMSPEARAVAVERHITVTEEAKTVDEIATDYFDIDNPSRAQEALIHSAVQDARGITKSRSSAIRGCRVIVYVKGRKQEMIDNRAR